MGSSASSTAFWKSYEPPRPSAIRHVAAIIQGKTERPLVMISIRIVSVLVVITLLGCSAEREISPTIAAAPRSGLVVSPPIIGAVYDGRVKQETMDVAATLQTELSRLYGPSIEWSGYFTKTPNGRVSVRIRIVTL